MRRAIPSFNCKVEPFNCKVEPFNFILGRLKFMRPPLMVVDGHLKFRVERPKFTFGNQKLML